jgi:hypothetical protein
MTTPHKWAAEIHAMADGKEVEGYSLIFGDGRSACWRPATYEYNPLTNPLHQWRIKPAKEPKYLYVYNEVVSDIDGVKTYSGPRLTSNKIDNWARSIYLGKIRLEE